MLLCLVKVPLGWHGWSLSGLGRELLSTGLLGAGKTGRGRSGVEGRLLLGHAASRPGWGPGTADGSFEGQHGCGSRLAGQAVPGVFGC